MLIAIKYRLLHRLLVHLKHLYSKQCGPRSDCSCVANSVDPDQTAPQEQSDLGPHCLSVWGNVIDININMQQTTSADDTFRWIFCSRRRANKVEVNILYN